MSPVVVDSSVAKASGGEEATHPTASHSRDIMLAIRSAKRALCYSEPIALEWTKHMSRFARQWLSSMHARKLVDTRPIEPQVGLRNKVKNCGSPAAERALMEKDFHLLDASCFSGGPIVSLDNSARRCFAKYYNSLGLKAGVHWTAPSEEAPSGFEWIKTETIKSQTRLLVDFPFC
jgi:hypothetical protein